MKSIQQILEEERQKSRLGKVSEADISRSISLFGISKDSESVKKSAQTRRAQNRHMSEEEKQRQRNARLGVSVEANKKPKTNEHKSKIAEACKGPKVKLSCPHCGKMCSQQNMSRHINSKHNGL